MRKLLLVLLTAAFAAVKGDPSLSGLQFYNLGYYGGALNELYGSGFSVDEFNQFDPNIGNVVTFVNSETSLSCKLVSMRTSENKLSFITPALPDNYDGPTAFEVVVYSNGKRAAGSVLYVYYYSWYSPRIDYIQPRYSYIGEIVKYLGYFRTDKFGFVNKSEVVETASTNSIQILRLYLSTRDCEFFDEERNELFGEITSRELYCKPLSTVVGGVNGSLVTSWRGRSGLYKWGLFPGPFDEIANNYQLAYVENVSTQEGSAGGGTPVRLTGGGFDPSEGHTKISLNGEECEIIHISDNDAVILTPPEQPFNGNAPGELGLLYESWEGEVVSDITDDAAWSSLDPTASNYNSSILREYKINNPLTGDSAVRVSGFFVAPHDGEYRFDFSTTSGTSAWLNFKTESGDWMNNGQNLNGQRVNLTGITPTYIEARMTGSSIDLMQLKFADFNSRHNYDQTAYSHNERHRFILRDNMDREKQTFNITGTPGLQKFSVNGQMSAEFDITNSTQAIAALMDMQKIKCTPDIAVNKFEHYYQYEDGIKPSGFRGYLDKYVEAYCGSGVVRTDGSYPMLLNVDSNDYSEMVNVYSHKYMCMAIKSKVAAATMKVGFRWEDKWKRTRKDLIPFNHNITTLKDTKWWYGCIDLLTVAQNSWIRHYRTDSSELYVYATWGPARIKESGHVYIDEYLHSPSIVSITRDHQSAWETQKIHLSDIEDEQLDATTYQLKFKSSNGGTGMPLLGLAAGGATGATLLTSDSEIYTFGSGSVTVTRTQSATGPATGNWSMVVGGQTIDGLTTDVDDYTLKSRIEAALNTTGIKAFKYGNRGYADWYLEYTRLPGQIPLPTFDISDMVYTGSSFELYPKRDKEGQNYHSEIGSAFFRTPQSTRMISVTVNNYPVPCLDDCSFEYVAVSSPPTFTGIAYSQDVNGDYTITATGTNFNSDDPNDYEFKIADKYYTATSVDSATSVSTFVGYLPTGTYPVDLFVSPDGMAQESSPVDFTIDTSITSIDPNIGGNGGGYFVTINGAALPQSLADWEGNSITFGGNPCPVKDAERISVTCKVPPGDTGAVDVSLTIGGVTTTEPSGFTYDPSFSAVISTTSQDKSAVVGGDVLNIVGTKFGDRDGGFVWIGDEECLIEDWDDALISCTIPKNKPGVYPVTVQTQKSGLAVGSATMHYELGVFAVSALFGSVYGGTGVNMNGIGFGTDPSEVNIMFGNQMECEIITMNDTDLTCNTKLKNKRYIVEPTSDGWSPKRLDIIIGDSVTFQWTRPNPNDPRKYSVSQTNSLTDEEYNGVGFTSGDPEHTDSYTHTFNEPGDFTYVSNEVSLGVFYSGLVRVMLPSEGVLPLMLSRGGILADNLSAVRVLVPTIPSPVGDCSLPVMLGCNENNTAVGPDFNLITADCYTPVVTGISFSGTESISGITFTQLRSGVTVTFTGSGFGTEICQMDVKFGDAVCTISAVTETSITCTLNKQENLLTLKPSYFTVATKPNGKSGPFKDNQAVIVPVMDSFSPTSGSLEGGTDLTITGSGFMSVGEEVSVTIGGRICRVNSVTHDTIECTTTSSTSGSHPVVVKISSFMVTAIDNSGGMEFAYDQAETPVIDAVSMNGNLLTFTGSNLDSDANNLNIFLTKSVVRENIDIEEDEEVIKARMVVAAKEKKRKHEMKKREFYEDFVQNREMPEEPISDVYPNVNEDEFDEMEYLTGFWGKFTNTNAKTFKETVKLGAWRVAGTSLFEEIEEDERRARSIEQELQQQQQQRQARQTSFLCVVVTATPTSVTCNMNTPAGNYVIQFSVAGKGFAQIPATASTLTSIATISGMTPLMGSVHGGATLTISGSGFNPGASTVTVDGADCQVQTDSTTDIVCSVPPHAAGLVPVEVTTGGSSYNTPDDFNYDVTHTPTITSVSPATVSVGDTITIDGTGFQLPSGSLLVQIGPNSKNCPITTSSATQIECTAPDLVSGTYYVMVKDTTYGDSNIDFDVTYDLSITASTPSLSGYGGAEVVISGAGFDPAGGSLVTVCGEDCIVTTGTSTAITCIVPPESTGATGNVLCDVIVTNPDGTDETGPDLFTYDSSLVAAVTSISPTMGGTAGGTTLTITGFGFDLSNNEVSIDGSICIIVSQSDTDIVCVTEPHKPHGQHPVRVKVPGVGIASTDQDGIFYYVDRWSSIYSWGGNPVPKDDDYVVIDKGVTIMLDVSTAILKMLLIKGGHVFVQPDATNLIKISSYYILIVDGGSLTIGTEEKPFTGDAIIELYGHIKSIELPMFGAKVIGVRNGTLDLHGNPVPQTWTKLSATATAGTSTITLKHPITGKPGDEIVIASTERRYVNNENEKCTILSISPDGKTVTLTKPLKYTHIGITQTFGTHVVETCAEVGLLTRNIKVMGHPVDKYSVPLTPCGSTQADTDQFTVQACFTSGGNSKLAILDEYQSVILIFGKYPDKDLAIARIEYVEITNAGQAFKLGRYPVHFHLNGNSSSCYIRGCAIHKTFNRALTIHGTQGLLVEKNVAYDIKGHAYFTEDGVETKNIIQYNLGVLVTASSSLLNEDITPATFWIVNPDNIVQHNAAAGGTHFGYWYRTLAHPEGAFHDPNYCPNNHVVGKFQNNTAHSFGRYGLWIFSMDGIYPKSDSSCSSRGTDVPGVFSSFTVWHTDRAAECVLCGRIQFRNMVVLDNDHAGLEMVETSNGGYGDDGPGIFDCLIIAHSGLSKDPDLYHTKDGVIVPKKKYYSIKNTEFINFDKDDIAALAGCSQCKPHNGGHTVVLENITYTNSPNILRELWESETVWLDIDGTTTGTPGDWLLPTNDLLPAAPTCVDAGPGYNVNPSVNASICDSSMKFHRVAVYNALPTVFKGRVATLTNSNGNLTSPFEIKRLSAKNSWMFVVPSQDTYTLFFDSSELVTNISYTAEVFDLLPGEYINIRHELFQPVDKVSTLSGVDQNSTDAIPEISVDDHGAYYYDNETKTVEYIVMKEDGTFPTVYDFNRPSGATKKINYESYRCQFDGCLPPTPPPMTGNFGANPYDWSDVDTWQYVPVDKDGPHPSEFVWRLPEEGDKIVLPAGMYVTVDIPTPPLDRVYIFGGLTFSDDMDHVFESNIIYVEGVLLAGINESFPFKHNLKILLRGDDDRNNDDNNEMMLSSRDTLGFKALGIFGKLFLHGKDTVNYWEKLGSTANVGDNTVTLANPVSNAWLGQEVLITSSHSEGRQAEIFTVIDISPDGLDLELDDTLSYEHLGETYSFPDSSRDYDMRAEVALMNRNIVIEGKDFPNQEKSNLGGRVLIGTIERDGVDYSGMAQISNVEFRRMGQGPWSDEYDFRSALSFYNLGSTDGDSYVKSCAFNYNYNSAITLLKSDNITVEKNAVYRVVRAAAVDTGNLNSWSYNLFAHAYAYAIYQDREEKFNLEWTGVFDLRKASPSTVDNNVIAGGDQAGFHMRGEDCSATTVYQNNEIHSCTIGVMDFEKSGSSLDCEMINDFYIWRISSFGIYYQSSASLEISDVLLVDCYAGVLPLFIGPHSLSHEFVDKSFTFTSSAIVGQSAAYTCDYQASKSEAYKFYKSKLMSGDPIGLMLAIFMSSANMAPKFAFSASSSYFSLGGRTEIEDVTFVSFKTLSCVTPIAIKASKSGDDGIHPISVEGLEFIDTDDENRLYLPEPNLGVINPSDCVDMDCDGLKKILINDVDGSLKDNGNPGTITAIAEFEFGGDSRRGLGYFRFPPHMNVDQDGNFLDPATTYPNIGIYRDSTCTLNTDWRAHECDNIKHKMLIIESMDSDTLKRRLSPVAIYGNPGPNGYVDLVNGPMDHGWCTGYTCQERISSFMSIVATDLVYEISFTSTPPQDLRLRMLDSSATECLVVRLFYLKPQRYDVYVDSVYMKPTNADPSAPAGKYQILPHDPSYYPDVSDPVGSNYFHQQYKQVHVVVCGGVVIDIKTTPTIVLGLGMTIDPDNFFEENVVGNLAALLGIDPKNIRITDIIREDTPVRRQMRQANESATIKFEVAENPGESSMGGFEGLKEIESEAVDKFQTASLEGVTSISIESPIPPPEEADPPANKSFGNVEVPEGADLFANVQQQLLLEKIEELSTAKTFEEPDHSLADLYCPDVIIAFVPSCSLNMSVFTSNNDPIEDLGASDAPWECKLNLTNGPEGSDVIGLALNEPYQKGLVTISDFSVNLPGDNYELHVSVKVPSSGIEMESLSYSLPITSRIILPTFALYLPEGNMPLFVNAMVPFDLVIGLMLPDYGNQLVTSFGGGLFDGKIEFASKEQIIPTPEIVTGDNGDITIKDIVIPVPGVKTKFLITGTIATLGSPDLVLKIGPFIVVDEKMKIPPNANRVTITMLALTGPKKLIDAKPDLFVTKLLQYLNTKLKGAAWVTAEVILKYKKPLFKVDAVGKKAQLTRAITNLCKKLRKRRVRLNHMKKKYVLGKLKVRGKEIKSCKYIAKRVEMLPDP